MSLASNRTGCHSEHNPWFDPDISQFVRSPRRDPRSPGITTTKSDAAASSLSPCGPWGERRILRGTLLRLASDGCAQPALRATGFASAFSREERRPKATPPVPPRFARFRHPLAQQGERERIYASSPERAADHVSVIGTMRDVA